MNDIKIWLYLDLSFGRGGVWAQGIAFSFINQFAAGAKGTENGEINMGLMALLIYPLTC